MARHLHSSFEGMTIYSCDVMMGVRTLSGPVGESASLMDSGGECTNM